MMLRETMTSSVSKEMTMKDHFAKLNRLRVNASKPELKSWKASQDKLLDAIHSLEKAGAVDVLPGANTAAVPVTSDPVVAAALKPVENPEPTEAEIADAKDRAFKTTVVKPGLGRGLGDEKYATHCRKAVQDHRRDEKKANKKTRDEKKALLSEADKAQIKDEVRLRKGEVDPKKDPAKAARQQKHIEDKKAARAAAGKEPTRKAVGKDEISVAEIARDLGIDPKIARAKLRRHEDKLTKLHSKGQDRWTFPKTAAAEIKKILK